MKPKFTRVDTYTTETIHATLSTQKTSVVISFDVAASQALSDHELLAALVLHIKAVNTYVDELGDCYVDFYTTYGSNANDTLVRIASLPYVQQLNAIAIDYLCSDKTVIKRVVECYL